MLYLRRKVEEIRVDFFGLGKLGRSTQISERLIQERLWQENGDCSTYPLGIEHGYVSIREIRLNGILERSFISRETTTISRETTTIALVPTVSTMPKTPFTGGNHEHVHRHSFVLHCRTTSSLEVPSSHIRLHFLNIYVCILELMSCSISLLYKSDSAK